MSDRQVFYAILLLFILTAINAVSGLILALTR